MTFFGKLRHWFTPHHTNNFRAKLLHNTGIVAVIAILLTGNLFIRLLDDPSLHILGFTSSITIDEIVRATNEQRVGAGLEPLSYSEKLADAARRKAANMFEENYWAHNSPSGKSPWVWIKAAGYNYVYAGENLAKDFGDTSRLMSAWMASPTHRDNVINSKYKEIGLAVVPGSILGQETVLVVQLFGTPNSGSVPAASPAAPNQAKAETPAPQVVAEVQGREVAEMVPSDVEILQLEPAKSPVAIAPAKFNKFSLARTLNLATTALFILALVVDLYLAESRKLSRRVGNNWAHILFINLILLVTVIVNAGKIM